MTLLSALRATKVLGLAVALVAGGMTAADAGDGWGSSRHHGHHHRSKWLPSIELPGHGGRLETVFHSGGEARQGWQDNGMRLGVFPAYRLRADSITIPAEGEALQPFCGAEISTSTPVWRMSTQTAPEAMQSRTISAPTSCAASASAVI